MHLVSWHDTIFCLSLLLAEQQSPGVQVAKDHRHDGKGVSKQLKGEDMGTWE